MNEQKSLLLQWSNELEKWSLLVNEEKTKTAPSTLSSFSKREELNWRIAFLSLPSNKFLLFDWEEKWNGLVGFFWTAAEWLPAAVMAGGGCPSAAKETSNQPQHNSTNASAIQRNQFIDWIWWRKKQRRVAQFDWAAVNSFSNLLMDELMERKSIKQAVPQGGRPPR